MSLSRIRLLATPWTAAYQAPPSMGFSRQEYWNGVPLPSPIPGQEPEIMMRIWWWSDQRPRKLIPGVAGMEDGLEGGGTWSKRRGSSQEASRSILRKNNPGQTRGSGDGWTKTLKGVKISVPKTKQWKNIPPVLNWVGCLSAPWSHGKSQIYSECLSEPLTPGAERDNPFQKVFRSRGWSRRCFYKAPTKMGWSIHMHTHTPSALPMGENRAITIYSKNLEWFVGGEEGWLFMMYSGRNFRLLTLSSKWQPAWGEFSLLVMNLFSPNRGIWRKQTSWMQKKRRW